jgi:hypothetical protein
MHLLFNFAPCFGPLGYLKVQHSTNTGIPEDGSNISEKSKNYGTCNPRICVPCGLHCLVPTHQSKRRRIPEDLTLSTTPLYDKIKFGLVFIWSPVSNSVPCLSTLRTNWTVLLCSVDLASRYNLCK